MPLPLGFVSPCLPAKALQPPTGEAWLHEIKHDGFRMMVRQDGTGVRLLTRKGVVGYFDRDFLNCPHLARTSPPPMTTKPRSSSMETIAAGP
jgi:hypothetical protein